MSESLTNTVDQEQFVFELSYHTRDQQPVGRERLSPRQLDRAVVATWFAAARNNRVSHWHPGGNHFRVEPLFVPDSPPGRTRGFRVTAGIDAEPRSCSCEFGLSYFQSHANRHRASLERERLVSGDAEIFYHLDAFIEGTDASLPGPMLTISEPSESVPIDECLLSDLGPVTAWDNPETTDPAVVISRAVIDATVEESLAAADREIGGILLGHLRRDAASGDIFVEVTAWIPAADTSVATALSVTFTPETFERARALCRLRARNEIIVGWQHSHPMRVCAECPLPMPEECIRKILFFSADDVQLMETTFPQPFMLGLLTAVEPRLSAALAHPPVRLFGWRDAVIRPRGFLVTNA